MPICIYGVTVAYGFGSQQSASTLFQAPPFDTLDNAFHACQIHLSHTHSHRWYIRFCMHIAHNRFQLLRNVRNTAGRLDWSSRFRRSRRDHPAIQFEYRFHSCWFLLPTYIYPSSRPMTPKDHRLALQYRLFWQAVLPPSRRLIRSPMAFAIWNFLNLKSWLSIKQGTL